LTWNGEKTHIMKRTEFIKTLGLGALAIGTKAYGLGNLSKNNIKKLTILHTNDWHSRIEPFPKGKSRNSDKGGAARRAALIRQIRKREKNVLLFDAGDIFQGTPYFNYFGGELEFKLMSKMRYDAATIGNHDFDGGMDGFKKAQKYAEFDFITTNYDFSNTLLDGRTKKYKIINIDGIKIGLLSANIELDGLVPKKLYKETKYLNPLEVSNYMAKFLKHEKKCDYVVCLSHLGYKYRNDKVSDITLAKSSTDIDLIIGGHTHTFMKEGDNISNKNGKNVVVTQAGWAGILLGQVDVYFTKKSDFIWSNSSFNE